LLRKERGYNFSQTNRIKTYFPLKGKYVARGGRAPSQIPSPSPFKERGSGGEVKKALIDNVKSINIIP
jgi:hypothetical protein